MPYPIDWSTALPCLAAALLGGYLLGSIPFGFLLTKLAGLGDIRNVGSGNIGATNVLRTGRKDLAATTLLLDGGKGVLAAYLGALFGPETMILAAAGAFLGHIFPVWLRFKGGKGVATFLGIILVFHWPAGLAIAGVWLAITLIFRISSLSALVASATSPFIMYALADTGKAAACAFMTLLIFYSHRENIGRLLNGTEPKFGQKK